MKQITSLLIVLCMLLLIFGGCTSSEKETRTNYPISGDPQYLDPQVAKGESANLVIANCFEGLFRYDTNGGLKPAAAESYEVSADKKIYTFHLRKNGKWHLLEEFEEILGENFEKSFDNSVTAADFVFAMQRGINPNISSPSAKLLFPIKNAEKIYNGKMSIKSLGVKALDDYTLEIELEKPNPDFPVLLTSAVYMPCNKTFFYATNGRYGTSVEFLMCNSVYYLSEWERDSYILLEKNGDYSGKSSPAASVLGFYLNTDNDSRLAKLNDKVYCASPLASTQSVNSDNVSVKEYNNKTLGIIFNCKSDVFSSLDFRLAYCYAINYSSESRTKSIIPGTCTVGTKSYKSTVTAVDSIEYDKNSALKYFNSAYSTLTDSVEGVSLLCDEEHKEIARELLHNWQVIFGYKLISKIEVSDDVSADIEAGNYSFALTEIYSDSNTAVGFISSLADYETNVMNYKSQNLNTVINQLLKSETVADRIAGCKQAEEHLMQNGVIYPLEDIVSAYGVDKAYKNIVFYPSGENICFVK